MNIFASQGFVDFIIATGYKSEVIETWIKEITEPWTVNFLNTGIDSQTAFRVKRCMDAFPHDRYFVTYGDGLGNVNLGNLLKHHISHRKIATVTAVRPPARFGLLDIDGTLVTRFGEKDQTSEGWINGGFFVFEREIASFIPENQSEVLESNTLQKLAKYRELVAYRHFGFWKPMDTLREKRELEALVQTRTPPWLILNDS